MRINAFRMVTLLSLLFIFNMAGCASYTTGYQGSPFFPYSDDLKVGLQELMKLEDRIASNIGAWNLGDVEKYILTSSKVAREKSYYPDLLPERYATTTAKDKVITKVWRFAPISVKTLSLPIKNWREASNVGFSLSATEHNGKLIEVKTGFVPMPENSISYSTKDAIQAAVGVGAILFLIP